MGWCLVGKGKSLEEEDGDGKPRIRELVAGLVRNIASDHIGFAAGTLIVAASLAQNLSNVIANTHCWLDENFYELKINWQHAPLDARCLMEDFL